MGRKSSKKGAGDPIKAAIGAQVRLGRELQSQYPHMNVLYRDDFSAPMIARKLIDEGFIDSEVSYNIALGAVKYALCGYSGEGGLHPGEYPGLIRNKKTLLALGKKHRLLGSARSGKISFDNGTGVHGRSKTKMRKDSLEGLLAKGLVPWSKKEVVHAYKLYVHYIKQGSKPCFTFIAGVINNRFHRGRDIRSRTSSYNAVRRYRTGRYLLF